jgi:crotonobetainyl-CoA:carnitine CoA-transferase CaiB-like acyl-CoA transferase
LCTVLGEPALAADASLATAAGRRVRHDEIDERIARWSSMHTASDAVDALQEAGVAAEVVIAPRDIARNPQLRHRGLFEVERHPVTGDHEVPMLPFRLSGVAAWLRFPSPTLGEHNAELLAEVGVDADGLAALAAGGIVGERPKGT